MGGKEEFLKNKSLYMILFMAGGTLMLVNKMEAPFARTLVVCDTPVSTEPGAEFSGSQHCGDRLWVIGTGQWLSSNAQGQESLAKFLSMLFVAAMCDIVGRKPSLCFGVTCCALSVLCHFVAAASPPGVAFKLFTLGQALQGGYPSELLSQIMVTDVCQQPGVDGVAVGSMIMSGFFAITIAMDFVGVGLNSLNLVDYRPLWFAILVLNAAVCVFAYKFCPETKPAYAAESDDKQPKNIIQKVKGELWEYVTMTKDNRLMRMLLISFVFYGAADAKKTLDWSFMMSYHGMTQAGLAKAYSMIMIVVALCIGRFEGMIQRNGAVKAWLYCVVSVMVCDILVTPFLLLSPWVLIAQSYACCYFAGYGGLETAVDSNYFDARLTVKFIAAKKLILYALGAITNPLYASLFDAQATTALGALKPKLFSAACQILHGFFLYKAWDMGEELGGIKPNLLKIQAYRDGMASEAAKKAQEGTTAEVKVDGEEKDVQEKPKTKDDKKAD